MTINIPLDSPPWLSGVINDTQNEIDERTLTLIGGKAFSISDLPDAATNRYKMVFVSDGASNKPSVVSDGTVWRYQDGVAV